ncbi:MAG: hypothetical protein Q8P41_10150 [Pseudomonadota bacterium]|nr:hypothetical protein [Pseudomonadota bacterium]
MFAFASLALAAPCPAPVPLPDAALSPDGAAHVLARDATTVCWWIVDDRGDARVAARWDRARRDPLALTALPDGRVVLVVFEPADAARGTADRWRLVVREEGGGDTRVGGVLPAAPVRMLANDEAPLVALVWADTAPVLVIDVPTGRPVVSAEVPGVGWRGATPWRSDAPR